ncbi:hypothetical protein Ancab_031052 [Ancistrocladus abbreviatus]
MLCATAAAAEIGVRFGLVGDDLPSNQQVVAIYNQYNVQRMRIHDPYSPLCDALHDSNIELMIGVGNQDLPSVASSQASGNSWVQKKILSYHPDVRFRHIAVGNEVRPDNTENGGAQSAPCVAPAMRNIQNAINQAGLGGQIKVSTAWELGILSTLYPPSGAPGVGVQDGQYGYQNLFDAMVDTVYSAFEKAGTGSVEIVMSETGWPTAGGKQTDVDTAMTYYSNLFQHLKYGTPKRPGKPMEIGDLHL